MQILKIHWPAPVWSIHYRPRYKELSISLGKTQYVILF